MKFVRLSLAAVVAACFLAATVAGACDIKNTAAKPGCTGKGDASQTAMKGCCAHAKGVGMTAEACTLRPGRVALKGTVLCNHCDLHKTDECQSVLRTSGGCTYVLATGDEAETLTSEAGHGSKIVKVKGTADDKGNLSVTSYRIVRDADTPGVGM